MEEIGKIYLQNCGDSLKILEKIKNDNNKFVYRCKFLKYPHEVLAYGYNIKNGVVTNPLIEQNEFIKNFWPQKCGDILKVLKKTTKKQKNGEYLWEVEFIKYPYKRFAYKSHIQNGQVANPFCPDKYGFFLGEGKYSGKDYKFIYNIWNHLKLRCYKRNYNGTYYNNIKVDEYFKNFQNFAKWYEESDYDKNKELYLDLDKDILYNIYHLEKKYYSQETCLLIPEEINSFLGGDCLKAGVRIEKYDFRVDIRNNNIVKFIGIFPTFEEAKLAYAKEKYNCWIILLAKYKNKLPEKIFNILLKYDFSWSWQFNKEDL